MTPEALSHFYALGANGVIPLPSEAALPVRCLPWLLLGFFLSRSGRLNVDHLPCDLSVPSFGAPRGVRPSARRSAPKSGRKLKSGARCVSPSLILLRALDGRFIRPAPGNDVCALRLCFQPGAIFTDLTPFVSRVPSPCRRARSRQPACSIVIYWMAMRSLKPSRWCFGARDDLKTEGAPIAQALALIGAIPRFELLRASGSCQTRPAGVPDAAPY